jgi:hypothetical protein
MKIRKRIAAALAAAGVFAAAALAAAQGAAPESVPGAGADNVLAGVIDIHCHTAPDVQPRTMTDLELARAAKAAGMRGIVLKNHFMPTADRAELAMQEAGGPEIFGGIVLNRSNGGLNAEAIRQMVKVEGKRGKVVWLPTQDAEAIVKESGQDRPFVPVVKDGKAVPELAEIFKLIAENDLLFETGHSSAAEAIVLIEAAKAAGVKRIVVTHAMALPGGGTTDEQMQRMADLGAYIECTWLATLKGPVLKPTAGVPDSLSAAGYARAIKKIGAEHFIISSDMGQTGRPTHPEAMRAFILALKKEGLSDGEIDLVARKNPARALGLEQGGRR